MFKTIQGGSQTGDGARITGPPLGHSEGIGDMALGGMPSYGCPGMPGPGKVPLGAPKPLDFCFPRTPMRVRLSSPRQKALAVFYDP